MSLEKKITTLLVNGLSHTPLIVSHAIANISGLLLWIFPNKKRKVTYLNLRLCYPDLSGPARSILILRSLVEDVKMALETPALMSMSGKKIESLVRHAEGMEHIEQAFAENKSVILAIPHIGNWEMIGFYCSRRHPMISLYRPQHRSSSADSLLKEGRERFGALLLPTDHSGIKTLFKTLSEKKLIAILPDQYPGMGQGIDAPFFGRNTRTMTLLPKLAHKGKSAIMLAYALRLPYGRGFSIHIQPIECDFTQADLPALAQLFNQKMEQAIAAAPAQYWWSYDRFRILRSLKPFTAGK